VVLVEAYFLILQHSSRVPLDYLGAKEKSLISFLNGEKSKFPKVQDVSQEMLKQLFRMVIFSCANKVESGKFDDAACSAHKAAIEKLSVSKKMSLRSANFN
jgi:hypothetical protein